MQEKLEKIGEVSIEDVSLNIGTFKYTKASKKTSNNDNVSSVSVPETPGENDHSLPVIELDVAQLEEFIEEEEEVYILDEKLGDIKGKVTANSKIIELTYSVDYGKMNLAEGNLSPGNEFTLEDLPLLTGVNTLTVEATDTYNNKGIYSIEIINMSEENSQDIIN